MNFRIVWHCIQSMNMRRIPNEADPALNYNPLKLICEQPAFTQREIAVEQGQSQHIPNDCFKAFVFREMLKDNPFRRSNNKLTYAYLKIRKGIEENLK